MPRIPLHSIRTPHIPNSTTHIHTKYDPTQSPIAIAAGFHGAIHTPFVGRRFDLGIPRTEIKTLKEQQYYQNTLPTLLSKYVDLKTIGLLSPLIIISHPHLFSSFGITYLREVCALSHNSNPFYSSSVNLAFC